MAVDVDVDVIIFTYVMKEIPPTTVFTFFASLVTTVTSSSELLLSFFRKLALRFFFLNCIDIGERVIRTNTRGKAMNRESKMREAHLPVRNGKERYS